MDGSTKVVCSRTIEHPMPAKVELTAVAGRKCTATVTFANGISRLFTSSLALPISITQSVRELMEGGRLQLDWAAFTFALLPKACGGGCHHASHVEDPTRGDSAATAKPVDPSQLPPHVHDLQEIFALSEANEDKDYEKLFRYLTTEKNFNMIFFESTLDFMCEHADDNDDRNEEAVHFLKTAFFRVFLGVTKSGKCIRTEVAESCRAKLTQMMRKVPQLTETQRLTLQMLQSGLFSLAQTTLVNSPEVMTGLEAAYEVLTNKRTDLSRGMPLTHVFFTRSDFLTSLAVELVLHLCKQNDFNHLLYILAVLNAAVKNRDRFAIYLLREVERYLSRIPGWVPDYIVLFEGEGELMGLSQLVTCEHNPEFALLCKRALLVLEKSGVPEIVEASLKALQEEVEIPAIAAEDTNSS